MKLQVHKYLDEKYFIKYENQYQNVYHVSVLINEDEKHYNTLFRYYYNFVRSKHIDMYRMDTPKSKKNYSFTFIVDKDTDEVANAFIT